MERFRARVSGQFLAIPSGPQKKELKNEEGVSGIRLDKVEQRLIEE